MEFDALTAFVAVAEDESFSRAADRLFLTQPAVSKRIAGLETELQVRLFDRIGRRVRLTAAGRELLPRARDLLDEIADTKRSILNLSESVSGTLSMGTSHHIGLHRLPRVLKRFSTDFPEVQLDIQFMDSEVACTAVAKGELELGIVTLPRDAHEDLHLEALWHDPLGVAVGRSHPLAASSASKTSIKRLLDHTAVLPARTTFTRAILEHRLGDRAADLRVGMSTNYLETLKMLAATGLGWTLLPRSMLDSDLVLLKIPGLEIHRTLGIATHSNHTLSNAAAAMIDACRRHADQA